MAVIEGGSPDVSVVGEAMSLAAQLRNLAAPNAVVIADSTRRLVGELFECRAVEMSDAPSEAPAWEVLRTSTVESRFEALRGLRHSLGWSAARKRLIFCFAAGRSAKAR